MKITLLSCAVDRPEAWALCEKYMSRQTRPYDQWIVVDDDTPQTVCTLGQDYFYKPEFKGRSSLAKKIKFVLDNNLITGDVLVFIENDDWYSPNYLEMVQARMNGQDIVGEGFAVYYNVKERWWYEHVNMQHASLCATAVSKNVFPALQRLLSTSLDPFVDVRIWGLKQFRKKVFETRRVKTTIGIKAMPGQPGYGGGHRERDRGAKDDLTLAKLASWIGAEDAQAYAPFWKNYNAAKPEPLNLFVPVGDSPFAKGHGPNWMKWLGHLRDKPSFGLEIGTFRGESAEWTLENILNHPNSLLMCLDPFKGSAEHALRGIDCSTTEQDARKRLERFGEKAIIRKAYSHEGLYLFNGKSVEELQGALLNFVYVDGDHSCRGVLRDAVLAFDVLKVGGVMIFDDYPWTDMPDAVDCPKTAVDSFLACYAKQIEILDVGYQVAIRKIAI